MKIALLGATGAVGRTMLQVLAERGVEVDELRPLASERSRGQTIRFGGRDWSVGVPEPGAFEGCDVALFSAGGARSREWAPIAASEGAIVIDNSSAWRMHADVPLVVPEVNGVEAHNRPLGIIANPNCSTIQLVVALEAIRRAAGLSRVVVTTLQSVSGAGQSGIDALVAERAGRIPEGSPFPAPIDGNAVPRIGPVGDDGFTEEETKVRNESRKILGMPELLVAATCVRVPVEIGHSISATIETERPLDVAGASAALRAMAGVRVLDGDALPLAREAAGQDDVLVGRIRQDPDSDRVLHIWVVADNLRKGAATNAVQIAEHVLAGGAAVSDRPRATSRDSARSRREESAGGVVIRHSHDGPLFLLIRDPYHNWGLPKGHIEPGETAESAARREVAEETGLTALELIDDVATIDWFFQDKRERVHKFCRFFLFLSPGGDTTPELDEGISACVWLPYAAALDRITYDNAREVLREAGRRLSLEAGPAA